MNLTGIILTYNEEANLRRSLEKLTWIPQIVILDSFSTDQTEEIAKSFPNVSFFQREFDNHTDQWNFALTKTDITTDWILSLDADYQIPKDLSEEIQKCISENSRYDAFWMHFTYAINGREIKSGIYPPVRALFRREKGRYEDDGHTQKLAIKGDTGTLINKAIHDDRKSMKRWLTSQWNYAELEAAKLLRTKRENLSKQDKIRIKRKFTPLLVFFYCIFIRRGWKDGSAGFQYAYQRMIAEILLQYSLIQLRQK